jgi:hypothetical protein
MNDENIVIKWRKECLNMGTTLNAICKTAGVRRGLLTQWQEQEPKTIQIMRLIEKEIENYRKFEGH